MPRVDLEIGPGHLILVKAAYCLGQSDAAKGVTAHDPAAILRDALRLADNPPRTEHTQTKEAGNG